MTSARTSASLALVVALLGAVAPEFTRPAVRGGTVSLARLRGDDVLLSFLNTSARAGRDPSRAQVVFLRSMAVQHRRLRVVIVDTSRASRAALLNYTYDWALPRAISVLRDDGSLARRYRVRKVPTTFLIGRMGRIAQRWNGFVLPVRLALAIESAG
jgi:peroxiredoxin